MATLLSLIVVPAFYVAIKMPPKITVPIER